MLKHASRRHLKLSWKSGNLLILRQFRILSKNDIPKGCSFGVIFTTITVNAPRHIQYLYRTLGDKHGVSFVRANLSDIRSAFASPSTKVVFNCTGNGTRSLQGVQDTKCYPTRGRILLTRAPHIVKNVMLAAFSGLRPSGEGGARVEKMSIQLGDSKNGVLVHTQLRCWRH